MYVYFSSNLLARLSLREYARMYFSIIFIRFSIIYLLSGFLTLIIFLQSAYISLAVPRGFTPPGRLLLVVA